MRELYAALLRRASSYRPMRYHELKWLQWWEQQLRSAPPTQGQGPRTRRKPE